MINLGWVFALFFLSAFAQNIPDDFPVAKETFHTEKLLPPFVQKIPKYQEYLDKKTFTLADLFKNYKDFKLSEKYLKNIAQTFPSQTTLHEIGETRRKHKLWALRIAHNLEVKNPAIFLNCAHHGNEVMTPDFCFRLISELLQGANHHWTSRYDFWIVPVVNPDGSENYWHRTRSSGRKNGRRSQEGDWSYREGVDLNRNYPFKWGEVKNGSSNNPQSYYYRGPAPASEPEIQAIMQLAGEIRPFLSISFHSLATKILTPYTIPGTKDPTPEVARFFAKAFALLSKTHRYSDQSKASDECKKAMTKKGTTNPIGLSECMMKYKVVKRLYSVDGTDQDWHYFKHGTLALLLESPFGYTAYSKALQVTRAAAQGLFGMLAKLEHTPRLLLTFKKEGSPIEVYYKFKQFQYNEGETRSSDAENGQAFILFPNAGLYHLQVEGREYPLSIEKGLNRFSVELEGP